jgi:DNA-binding winged helix-turn-helix (wHTH) protein
MAGNASVTMHARSIYNCDIYLRRTTYLVRSMGGVKPLKTEVLRVIWILAQYKRDHILRRNCLLKHMIEGKL